MPSPAAEPLVSRIRVYILGALLVGIAGTGAELLVSGHTEDALQWAPLSLIAVCVLTLIWHAAVPSAAGVCGLQAVMILFVAAGVAGLAAHWQGKIEFKREMDPSLTGLTLFWEAMKSKSPLAPGVMIQLAILGLVYAYRHPALETSAKRRNT